MAQLKSTNITGKLSVTGDLSASTIKKLGGASDEILMADGSVSTAYLTSADAESVYQKKTDISLTDTDQDNNKPLITGIAVNGHTITVTRSDLSSLGLSTVMHFVGAYATAPSKAFQGTGGERNLQDGDVYLNTTSKTEYIYSNGNWTELGNEGSHALKTISIIGTNGLEGGGTLEQDRTISLKDGGVTTGKIADKAVTAAKLADDIDFGVSSVSLGEGGTNGTLKLVVNGQEGNDIKVKGLGTAAYTASTDYDEAGTAKRLIEALDVSDTAQTGKYVSAVSELDGKISVTRASLPTIPTHWANVELGTSANSNTVPTFSPGFKVNVVNNTAYTPSPEWAWSSPVPKYLWHDLIAFKEAVFERSIDGNTWTQETGEKYTKGFTNKKENQTEEVVNSTSRFARWTWTGGWHACQASWLVIGFTYQVAAAKCRIILEGHNSSNVSTTPRDWVTNLDVTHTGQSSPVWFKLNPNWLNTDQIRLTIQWYNLDTNETEVTHDSKGNEYKTSLSQIKFLTHRWGNQGFGSEQEYPYEWSNNQDIYPRETKKSSLGVSSREWANVYTNNLQATTINSVPLGSTPKFTDTWQENTCTQNGYVPAPTSSNANKVWKTDSSGEPGWRDDADTTYTGDSGITVSTDKKIKHSNSISAQTTQGLYKIAYDAQGHITSTESFSLPTKQSWNYDDAYVKYSGSQSLTDEQKEQARKNIGAGTSDLVIGTTSTTVAAGNHTHQYAGSDTTGGAANSAEKLTNTSKIGDTNKPVYFTADGKPAEISYIIEKSVPSNAVFTDTTYGFVGGTNKITVKPSVGEEYDIPITPSIANNVTGSGLTADKILLGNGGSTIKTSGKTIATSVGDSDDTLPTSKAVKTFVEGKKYVTSDTKNTAGTTNNSSKLYLIGATEQSANPQTYSDSKVYTTDGTLTTTKTQIGGGAVTMEYDTTKKALKFKFS